MSVIARESMGFCTCGSRIEAGELIVQRPEGALHVGCRERVGRTENAGANKVTVSESGFLFSEMETRTIEEARQTIGASSIQFDGLSAMQIDTVRLATQLSRVYNLMRDGHYRTLTEIATATGCLETSASARLRDFRKKRFGAHQVIPRKNSEGVNEYRLILRDSGTRKQNAA